MRASADYNVIVIMLDSFRQDHIGFYNRGKPVFEGIDRCIRDREWSYIQRPEGEPDELYNLVEDPKERINLIDGNPEEAQRLSSLFGQYYRRASVRVIKGVQGRYEVASGVIE